MVSEVVTLHPPENSNSSIIKLLIASTQWLKDERCVHVEVPPRQLSHFIVLEDDSKNISAVVEMRSFMLFGDEEEESTSLPPSSIRISWVEKNHKFRGTVEIEDTKPKSRVINRADHAMSSDHLSNWFDGGVLMDDKMTIGDRCTEQEIINIAAILPTMQIYTELYEKTRRIYE